MDNYKAPFISPTGGNVLENTLQNIQNQQNNANYLHQAKSVPDFANLKPYPGAGTTQTTPTPQDDVNTEIDYNAELQRLLAQQAAADRAEKLAQARRGIDTQTAHLGGVDSAYNTSLSKISDELARILGGYDAQTASNRSRFDDQMGTNRSNFDRNTQEAMVNAARGRQGLFGTLSSMGALSGSGLQLADRAVQHGANADLSGANEQFRTNADDLSAALSGYEREDEARREEARRQAEGLKQNALNTRLNAQQEAYQKMVDLYSTLGNSAEADRYTRMGADLSTQIGNTAFNPATAFTRGTANFDPGSLGYYTGSAPEVSVMQGDARPGSMIPSLMASIRQRDRERE